MDPPKQRPNISCKQSVPSHINVAAVTNAREVLEVHDERSQISQVYVRTAIQEERERESGKHRVNGALINPQKLGRKKTEGRTRKERRSFKPQQLTTTATEASDLVARLSYSGHRMSLSRPGHRCSSSRFPRSC